MIEKPEFDIILWGGSGFVGKLVAEHLHQQYGVSSEPSPSAIEKEELNDYRSPT